MLHRFEPMNLFKNMASVLFCCGFLLISLHVSEGQMDMVTNNTNMNDMHNNTMDHNMTGHGGMDMNNMTGHMHNMSGHMHNMTGHGGMDMNNMTGHMHNMSDHMHNMTGHDDMDHGNMDHSNTGHAGGHPLYFYFGTNETIVFKEWVTYNDTTIGLACLYVLLIAIFYEGLKVFRDYLYKLEKRKRNSSEWKYSMDSKDSQHCTCMGFFFHIIQAILHMIQVFISLCLMLIFMTFNAYLCIATVVGAGLGYLFFGWNRSKSADANEHCN